MRARHSAALVGTYKAGTSYWPRRQPASVQAKSQPDGNSTIAGRRGGSGPAGVGATAHRAPGALAAGDCLLETRDVDWLGQELIAAGVERLFARLVGADADDEAA